MILLAYLVVNLLLWVVFGFLIHYKTILLRPDSLYIYRFLFFFVAVIVFLLGRFLLIFLKNFVHNRRLLEIIIYLPSLIITLIGAYFTVLAGNGREMLIFAITSLYYLVRHYRLVVNYGTRGDNRQ